MTSGEVRANQRTPGPVGSSDPKSSRHRSHQYPARRRAVLVRYDDDEYRLISHAAGLAGLTPTGFVASVALAVAQATCRSDARSGAGPADENPAAEQPPAGPDIG